MRLVRADGEQFWAHLQVTPGQNGEFWLVLTDISKSKQAENEIRRSEERFRAIFERSTVGKSLTAPEGKLLQVNQALADMLGYSVEEMQQLDFAQVTHPDDVAASREYIRSLMAGERAAYRFEKRYIHKSGTIVWADVSSTLLCDELGTPLHLITSVIDITERKRAGEVITRAKNDWERTFDAVPDLIAIIDTNHTITRVNKAMADRCGYKPEDIIGRKCHEVMHGMADPPIFCPHVSMMQDGLMHSKGIDEKWLNGSFDILVVPLYDNEGLITTCVHVARDITERKCLEQERQQLEQQFQQTQKLESLGILAGGIAHDFNNILTIIICNCSLLQQRPAMVLELVSEIETAAQRAADLCRQMLIYAGKAQPNPTKFNMNTLVEEMAKLLKATINQNVTITLVLSADIPFIKADASQIRQIVMNLIINASEAIGAVQGNITVSLAIEEFKVGQSEKDYIGKIITPGSYICLNVTDNGCGMDEETKRRIFEPFYTTKFTGRGLGMSAVLGIITAHKGALQLTSQQGLGTTFKVFLPVQSSEPVGDVLPHVPLMPWQGSGTILLVEDEPQLIMVAKALIQALGFSVLQAANGQVALEMYQKHANNITLVLTDIGMPVMDGYELIHELKILNPELPIIVSSGFGDAEVTTHIQENIAGCVSKPYSFDQLREVLKGVVEGQLPKLI